MVRPVRNKKPVNYAQADSSGDDDDDFMPVSKKPRTGPKERTQHGPEAKLRTLRKASAPPPPPEDAPRKRVPLDDKIFQRGLEAALALSAKEPAAVGTRRDPSGSDRNGAAEEGGGDGSATRGPGKRKAAAAAALRTKAPRTDGSEDDSADDGSGSDGLTGEGEEDSDLSESLEDDDDDDDFAVAKRKAKAIKATAEPVKRPPPEQSEERRKPGCGALATSVAASPAAAGWERQPSPSKAPRTPAESKRPSWVPPAPSGSGRRQPLGASAPSPSQNLRLGLSRRARVRPLHPSAAGSPPG